MKFKVAHTEASVFDAHLRAAHKHLKLNVYTTVGRVCYTCCTSSTIMGGDSIELATCSIHHSHRDEVVKSDYLKTGITS